MTQSKNRNRWSKLVSQRKAEAKFQLSESRKCKFLTWRKCKCVTISVICKGWWQPPCTSHLDEDASGGSREDRMRSGRDSAPKLLIPSSATIFYANVITSVDSLSRCGNPRSVKCTHIDIGLHQLFGAVNNERTIFSCAFRCTRRFRECRESHFRDLFLVGGYFRRFSFNNL